ncbi:hypothetical protein AB0N14_17490 [Streptomyces sp. NPDC051104]|uniref:hypothetical protein n=1 Tax=Streptomyces sp. NPDC051104 TaxID=3155044 RepID=UPI0034401ABE
MENRTVVGLAAAAVAALIIGTACSGQLGDDDSGCQGAGQLHAAPAAAAKPTRLPAGSVRKVPAAPPKTTKAPATRRPAPRISKAPHATKTPHTGSHGHHGGHGPDIDIDLDGC